MGTRPANRSQLVECGPSAAEAPHKTRSPTIARKSGHSATIWSISWRPAWAFDWRQTSRRRLGGHPQWRTARAGRGSARCRIAVVAPDGPSAAAAHRGAPRQGASGVDAGQMGRVDIETFPEDCRAAPSPPSHHPVHGTWARPRALADGLRDVVSASNAKLPGEAGHS